ncbi:interleukin-1 receptor-associated kinase 1-binding protein 1 [Ailuropoda melanoleuca]|uniref:interleukin-1 receptor-associated kinase 1-binding protein 1 n=1 Tax=Ailuropoda melanoleuca TaxID=9646 RepID=UPI001494FB69|nr:interleukin-1 receptor-associated kinase 1-binding protein 1 [Ailuropoda melanoleuca]
MSLQQAPPSRVFVELVPWADRGRENNVVSGGESQPGLRRPLSSFIRQTSSFSILCHSDFNKFRFLPDVLESLHLVAKPLVIILLYFLLQAENVTVTKDFRRVENAYHMEAEVCITFTEFGKMQNICNFLIEKLDSSVVISQPQFYHTPGSVENLRRKACLVAVENAWRKAQEVCNLVGQTLGKPLLIKEEETKEWEGQIDDLQSSRLSSSLTVQQKIKSATIHAASKVFITFEVKGKEKKRKNL